MEKATNILKCPKCGCTWLKEERANSYKNIQVIAGQLPPKLYASSIPILVCCKCNTMVKINVLYNSRNEVYEKYTEIKDTLMEELGKKPIKTTEVKK